MESKELLISLMLEWKRRDQNKLAKIYSSLNSCGTLAFNDSNNNGKINQKID